MAISRLVAVWVLLRASGGGTLSLNGFSLTKKELFSLISFLFSIISFKGDRPAFILVYVASSLLSLLRQEPSLRILAMKVENELEVATLISWLLRSGVHASDPL